MMLSALTAHWVQLLALATTLAFLKPAVAKPVPYK